MHKDSFNLTAASTVYNMAFRSVQETLKPLLFLLIPIFCLNILTDQKAAAVNIREKCMCIREANSVPWRRTMDFDVFNSGPLCKKVQIIIKLGSRSVCLDPNSTQGKRLQKCWKRINFNKEKKQSCLPSGKVKKRLEQPKML